jgi:hypothetical protein
VVLVELAGAMQEKTGHGHPGHNLLVGLPGGHSHDAELVDAVVAVSASICDFRSSASSALARWMTASKGALRDQKPPRRLAPNVVHARQPA